MSEGPAHVYYDACEGRWRSPVEMTVHDPGALAASGMGLFDRLSVRLLAAWPRWLGRVLMHTTVAKDGDEVVHTTTFRWLGLPIRKTVEVFTLAADGRSFTVTGALEGEGHVEHDTAHAVYSFRWLGVQLSQRTERDGDRVTVHQEGPGFRGVQRLQRISTD